MAIAAVGALAIGATGEAVTVVLLYTLGEALEAYSAERARGSLRSLLSLQPQEATVLREHHDEHDHGHHDGETRPRGSPLPPGRPAGGRRQRWVTSFSSARASAFPWTARSPGAASSVNQAAVTGESIPMLRAAGDDVMAGTVNGEGALEIRVTRPAG